MRHHLNNAVKLLLLACVALFALPTPVRAEFALSNMILDFPAKGPRQQDVQVISKDEETQYLQMSISEIENPGTPQEQRIPVTTPENAGIIVSPMMMVLPAGVTKTLRFILMNEASDKEKIYRVSVKPVVNGVEPPKDKQIGVKILVGYEVLVLVRPLNAKADIVGHRNGSQLTLTNHGNTNVIFQSGKQCQASGDCKEVKVRRIYPTGSQVVDLPFADQPVTLQVFDGVTPQKLTF
ncbi:MAG: fimbria/pilus periplasmic chaperone [Alphaproteobacteria bacterium]|nr:fimbria/pilus periplasmic chaperone [Alphaproteobacteria bacterium]